MDDDQDFRFSLVQGRIVTELKKSDPGFLKRILELELERSEIIDSTINSSPFILKPNVYDKRYIERKPRFKQIEENFQNSFELPRFQEAVDNFIKESSDKIEQWDKNKIRLKTEASENGHESQIDLTPKPKRIDPTPVPESNKNYSKTKSKFVFYSFFSFFLGFF